MMEHLGDTKSLTIIFVRVAASIRVKIGIAKVVSTGNRGEGCEYCMLKLLKISSFYTKSVLLHS